MESEGEEGALVFLFIIVWFARYQQVHLVG